MAPNLFELNDQKTEILIFGPCDLFSSPTSDLGPQGNHNKPSVTNLSVILHNSLTLEKQIKAVVKASFLQLRVLTRVKPILSFFDFEKMIHAFISSQLDYCNSLYSGISQSVMSHLRSVQNADTWLVTETHKQECILPVLRPCIGSQSLWKKKTALSWSHLLTSLIF